MDARFRLQNKYQDSGWKNLDNVKFYQQDLASTQARNLSKNSIFYGMVRVIDSKTKQVIATFTNGQEV